MTPFKALARVEKVIYVIFSLSSLWSQVLGTGQEVMFISMSIPLHWEEIVCLCWWAAPNGNLIPNAVLNRS
jgi:hypothetical protein